MKELPLTQPVETLSDLYSATPWRLRDSHKRIG
jgi:hypothetical protein